MYTRSTSIAIGNRIYLFIYLSVITEVTKHFMNMLQQALGRKVVDYCVSILKGTATLMISMLIRKSSIKHAF